MNRVLALAAAVALLCLGLAAQAAINIETVRIGDPGNVGVLSGSGDTERICGAVSYEA